MICRPPTRTTAPRHTLLSRCRHLTSGLHQLASVAAPPVAHTCPHASMLASVSTRHSSSASHHHASRAAIALGSAPGSTLISCARRISPSQDAIRSGRLHHHRPPLRSSLRSALAPCKLESALPHPEGAMQPVQLLPRRSCTTRYSWIATLSALLSRRHRHPACSPSPPCIKQRGRIAAPLMSRRVCTPCCAAPARAIPAAR